jgi:hypothetical protein
MVKDYHTIRDIDNLVIKSTTMKKTLHNAIMGAALLLSFSSCSVYQMNTISSPTLVPNPKNGAFVQENDSLRISYTFGAQQAPPIAIEIFNKLNEPLIIDWQRSALVYNGSTISYVSNKGSFEASSGGYSYNVTPRVGIAGSTTTGQFTLPAHVDFIPPHASVKSVPAHLPGDLLFTIPDTAFHAFPLALRDNTAPAKAYKAAFTNTNSPLVFTSYLTFYNNNKDNATTVAYQHQFFVSEIVQTKAIPENTYYLQEQPGQRFYGRGSNESINMPDNKPATPGKSTVIGVSASNVVVQGAPQTK